MVSRNQSIHCSKLDNAIHKIDTSSPLALRDKKNKKKLLMQELKFTEIERANRILLEKMSKIFDNKTRASSFKNLK